MRATVGVRPNTLHLVPFFNFKGGSDGGAPEAGLLNVNGTLYGTTTEGGTGCGKDGNYGGCGTVFAVDPSGQMRTIYRFKGGYGNNTDGAQPEGHLTYLGGVLYGTTTSGGSCAVPDGCGTVFEVSTAGQERVLHRFKTGKDGSTPLAGLVAFRGNLYGTTSFGGEPHCLLIGCGTVFEITPSGKKSTVHVFKGGADGMLPGEMVAANGALFGVTSEGGSVGQGTVFTVGATGLTRPLYSFKGGMDGADPLGGLLAVNGLLYGTTVSGGGGVGCNEGSSGCGTVYMLNAAGSERVLYQFQGGSDGASPQADLIYVKGALYSTTAKGGGSGCVNIGCGTVYKVGASGAGYASVSFNGGSDGARPEAGLTNVNGVLFGTTTMGGSGFGTAFKAAP